MTTDRSAIGAAPFLDEGLGHVQPVEHARDRMIDDVVETGWAIVERWHGRHDDRAHLGERDQHSQMTEMQRRLADDQN
jgi:hypothetical protein